jgi:membrane associated rhomboid family serine protease
MQAFTEAMREPIFNAPPIVPAACVALALIHVVLWSVLSEGPREQALIALAFDPARYGPMAALAPYPLAKWWTPVTYSLLHGSWTHLGINLVWLLAFATPVVRRIGAARALALAAAASLGGALAHTLANGMAITPMIGASAIVAGFMGAAAHLAFAARGLADHRLLAFVGVWLLTNWLFGSGLVDLAGDSAAIAWQAHVGGFAAGLGLFPLLARIARPA